MAAVRTAQRALHRLHNVAAQELHGGQIDGDMDVVGHGEGVAARQFEHAARR